MQDQFQRLAAAMTAETRKNISRKSVISWVEHLSGWFKVGLIHGFREIRGSICWVDVLSFRVKVLLGDL